MTREKRLSAVGLIRVLRILCHLPGGGHSRSLSPPRPSGGQSPGAAPLPGARLDTAPATSVRPLTTWERSRVQTFPRGWVWDGREPKGVTEQLIGNAVPAQMARFVAEGVRDSAPTRLPTTQCRTFQTYKHPTESKAIQHTSQRCPAEPLSQHLTFHMCPAKCSRPLPCGPDERTTKRDALRRILG